jgi:hypothetical protein
MLVASIEDPPINQREPLKERLDEHERGSIVEWITRSE